MMMNSSFPESYYYPEDTSLWLFYDRNGAKNLWIHLSSSFIDMSLVAFIE